MLIESGGSGSSSGGWSRVVLFYMRLRKSLDGGATVVTDRTSKLSRKLALQIAQPAFERCPRGITHLLPNPKLRRMNRSGIASRARSYVT
jgi:hypothetical protein